MASILIKELVGLATVQDLGRYGYKNLGVPTSGPLDLASAVYANALVGNERNAALIELIGYISLTSDTNAVISITGGLPEVYVDQMRVPSWRAIYLKSGAELIVNPSDRGYVHYISIAGGIDCESVLGSKSTFIRGGFGCIGRPLNVNDRLLINRENAENVWGKVKRLRPAFNPETKVPKPDKPNAIRVTRGIHADLFNDLDILFMSAYTVTINSDRMGYRLDGKPVKSASLLNRLPSIPTDRGYVQIPPDGKPIVLMADSQTTGGYPVALHVIPPDVDFLAQVRPQQKVLFLEITVPEAEKLTSDYFDEVENPNIIMT